MGRYRRAHFGLPQPRQGVGGVLATLVSDRVRQCVRRRDQLAPRQQRPASATPMNDLTILFEDNHCLAVAKPAPLLTQGVPPGIPTLESQVKAYLKAKYHKAGNVYLGIPHRLDRPVSGVVLFARNTKAARRLAEQFQQRQVRKVYWAIVEGTVNPQHGTWEDWLLKLPEESRTIRADPEIPRAKHAA